jgi:hypothetical protein
LARWTAKIRWIVGYRLTHGSRPNDYVRTEGRIPSHLETGNWYDSVPEAVHAAFSEVGLSVDDPPFPRPEPEPPRRVEVAPVDRPGATAPPPLVRRCPACSMQKANSQFTAGSDLCVDCR